jgi:hypothetical protein
MSIRERKDDTLREFKGIHEGTERERSWEPGYEVNGEVVVRIDRVQCERDSN